MRDAVLARKRPPAWVIEAEARARHSVVFIPDGAWANGLAVEATWRYRPDRGFRSAQIG